MAERFGRFELNMRLGAGGLGEVFLAQDGDRQVAVKRFHVTEDFDFVKTLLDEVQVYARLDHPKIARFLDSGRVDDCFYVVSEYVAGSDLRKLLGHVRRLPPGIACRIAIDVAEALSYAHAARDQWGKPLRIVHRDVSPHNIIVGNDGRSRLIDFGTARMGSASGDMTGKAAYMAPEQALGKPMDQRMDQFSLAVVLWEMLSGRRLFDAPTFIGMLERAIACDIEPPGGDERLSEVVMRALSKAPEDRFPDCGAFRSALEDAAMELDASSTADDVAAFVKRYK